MDVPIGQELLRLLVVELLLGFHLKPAFVEQREEEVLRHLVVLRRGRAAVVVEADVEPGECFLHLDVVRVDDFSRGGAFLFCTKRDRRTVFIAPTNPKHVFPHAPQMPNVDVCGQICACNVAEVNRPVGVGKRGSDHPPLGGVLRHGDKSNSGGWEMDA